MAQIQGGTIELDTEEPGYTSVRVSLPAAPDFAVLATAVHNEADLCVEFPDVRLLIADDDPMNRAYLSHLLPSTWTVFCAENGDQAVEILSRQAIEVALLDLEMPGQTGIDAVKHYLVWRMGQNPWPPRARLLALTGHHDPETQQKCRTAGFEQILVKPIGKAHLCAALRSALVPVHDVVEIEASLSMLIPEFLRSRQEELARLACALAQQDRPAIISIAHRLQGSFALYGFAEASRLATAIEKMGPNGLLETHSLFHDLVRHLEQIEIRYR